MNADPINWYTTRFINTTDSYIWLRKNILIPIHVEQSNTTDSYIGLRKKRFSETSFGWCSLFGFSQFSCEMIKRVAPFEAIPGFSDGVTTRYIFYISVFLLLLIHATRKTNATYLYLAPRPPSPKSCRNTTRTRGVTAKRISASSWGQYTSFQRSGDKKSTSHHFKNSPFVSGRAEPMHIE